MIKMNKLWNLIIVAILMTFTICYSSTVQATNQTNNKKSSLSMDEIITNAESAVKRGQQRTGVSGIDENGNFITSKNFTVNQKELRDSASRIYRIAVLIGVSLMVIIGGILGIKFIMASVEDKAKIKEMMIPYIIGCVVIAGGYAIWKLVMDVLQQM